MSFPETRFGFDLGRRPVVEFRVQPLFVETGYPRTSDDPDVVEPLPGVFSMMISDETMEELRDRQERRSRLPRAVHDSQGGSRVSQAGLTHRQESRGVNEVDPV